MMSKVRAVSALLLWCSALSGGVVLADTPAAPAPAQSIRPEVGKPLQEAQDDLKARKFPEASAKLDEAEKVGGLTQYEQYVVARLRASVALGTNDNAKAAQAFEAVLATGQAPQAERLQIEASVGQLYYRTQDYAKAADALQRYKADGGGDPQMLALYPQALFLQGNYAAAATELKAQIAAGEQAGQAPSERQLQLLGNCALKLNDGAMYIETLQKFVTYMPQPAYWADLISRVQSKDGFSDRLWLDADRLRLATDALDSGPQHLEAVQLALQVGQPAEAQSLLNRGYAKGVLTGNADAAKLKTQVERAVADDKASLAPAKGGNARVSSEGLINTGLDYIAYGQNDKGAALIDQGLQKGGFKHADEALLHAGYGYYAAGSKDKAAQTFKQVQGKDGSADLARLWLILLKAH